MVSEIFYNPPGSDESTEYIELLNVSPTVTLDLTGLPPTVGFYGKLLLFYECIAADLGWLVVVAALNSVVSLFYYFRVAKALFLGELWDV